MRAFVLLESVAFFLLTHSYNVWGELPSPSDVTLDTLNTHYVLRWHWSREHAGNQNVTFTAQYLPKYKLRRQQQDWTTVCEGVSEVECDITMAGLNYLGMFLLRVRASAHTHTHTLHSAWVNLSFCPDSDAALGPPSQVEVSAQGRGLLEVKISDPVTHSNQSMRVHVPSMYFRLQYWRQDTPTEAQVIDRSQDLLTLSDLAEWVVYCVRIQTRSDFYNKTSTFTVPQCRRTQGRTPYWEVVLWFLLSLLLVFGLVLLFAFICLRCCGVLKSTYFPSNQLPVHIQEYLVEAPSNRPHLLTPESESELLIGRLDVCPEAVVVPALSVAEEQHEVYHDRHGSGGHYSRHGSGDSGVYSSGEASGGGVALQETEGERRSGEMEGGREVVEMKIQAVEEDEGVRDVCV